MIGAIKIDFSFPGEEIIYENFEFISNKLMLDKQKGNPKLYLGCISPTAEWPGGS